MKSIYKTKLANDGRLGMPQGPCQCVICVKLRSTVPTEPDSGIQEQAECSTCGRIGGHDLDCPEREDLGKPDAPADHVEHVLQKAHHVLGCLSRALKRGAMSMNPATLTEDIHETFDTLEKLLSEHRSGSEVSGVAASSVLEWMHDEAMAQRAECECLKCREFRKTAPSAPSSTEQKVT